MGAQHIDVGSGIMEAQFVTASPPTGDRWYSCQICGLDFPADKVTTSGGAAFCYPNGCHKDMNTRRH